MLGIVLPITGNLKYNAATLRVLHEADIRESSASRT